MNKNILAVTVGLPRSGKSTWARRESLADGSVIVNPDSIRLALHGQRYVAEAEPMVWAITRIMIDALFNAGHSTVILDATSILKANRAEWVKPDKWNVVFIDIPTSEFECVRRANVTNDFEIIAVIRRMAQAFEPIVEVDGFKRVSLTEHPDIDPVGWVPVDQEDIIWHL